MKILFKLLSILITFPVSTLIALMGMDRLYSLIFGPVLDNMSLSYYLTIVAIIIIPSLIIGIAVTLSLAFYIFSPDNGNKS